MALENAGFGIQFCDVSRDYGGELFGSEVPIQVNRSRGNRSTHCTYYGEVAAETVSKMDTDSAPPNSPSRKRRRLLRTKRPDLHIAAPACGSQNSHSLIRNNVSEITQCMTVDEAKAVVVQNRHLPRLDARTSVAQPPGESQMVSLWLRTGGQYSQGAAASVLLDNLQQKAG